MGYLKFVDGELEAPRALQKNRGFGHLCPAPLAFIYSDISEIDT